MSQTQMTEQEFWDFVYGERLKALIIATADLERVATGEESGCVDKPSTTPELAVPGGMLLRRHELKNTLHYALKRAPIGTRILIHRYCGYLYVIQEQTTIAEQNETINRFVRWIADNFPGKSTVVIEPHGSAQPYMN